MEDSGEYNMKSGTHTPAFTTGGKTKSLGMGGHTLPNEGATKIWLTPPHILGKLGRFDLDPCAAPSPRPWATADRHIELPEDGLSASWYGQFCESCECWADEKMFEVPFDGPIHPSQGGVGWVQPEMPEVPKSKRKNLSIENFSSPSEQSAHLSPLHNMFTQPTGDQRIFSTNEDEDEWVRLHLSELSATDSSDQTRGKAERSGRKSEVISREETLQSITQGSNEETGAIGNFKPSTSSAEYGSTFPLEFEVVEELPSVLESSMRLLQKHRHETNSGSFHPDNQPRLSRHGDLEYGPSMSIVQLEKEQPKPLRLVQGPGTPCPHCGGITESKPFSIYLNPPYDKSIDKWIERMNKHAHGISLIFARTETSFWQEAVWPHAHAILFLNGRLFFHTPDGKRGSSNAGAPSVLIAHSEGDADILENSKIEGYLVRESFRIR